MNLRRILETLLACWMIVVFIGYLLLVILPKVQGKI
jgi:hypothetical protein